MNKKMFGVAALVGVLVLMGAGCGSQNPANNQNTADSNEGTQGSVNTNEYGSAQEIATPNAVADELKSIISEACGGVKFTRATQDPLSKADLLVYIGKDEPTEAKLTNVFTKNGYNLDAPGEALMFSKGGKNFVITWANEPGSHEIVVMIYRAQ